MITVDTIGRVRHAFHVKGRKIKEIARDFRLARNTVRTIVRGEETEHRYERTRQPLPKLGGFSDQLTKTLASPEVVYEAVFAALGVGRPEADRSAMLRKVLFPGVSTAAAG